MASNILILFIALGIAFLAYRTFLTYGAYHRLAHFDGPEWAAYSRLWMLRTFTSGRQHAELLDVCQKHGPVARIGPNCLVTSDHNVLLQVTSARSAWTRSAWYRAARFDATVDSALSERNDKKHTYLRSLVASGYAGKESPDLEDRMNARVTDMIDLIQRKYLSTPGNVRVMDFCNLASFFTLDAISDIAFGEPFGCLLQDTDIYGYMTSFQDSGRFLAVAALYPWIFTLLETGWVRNLLRAPSPQDKIGLGRVVGLAQEVVMKRFKSDKPEQMDMLGSFIRHGMTQIQAESEVVLQILAGADTTASAFRATMLHVITNPCIYAALLAEIIQASKSGAISSPISDSEAQQLHYLQATIREGLRVFPPLTTFMPKDAPPEGDTINGRHVPGGTQIGFAMFAMQRQKHVFGNDADIFRPERWLEASPEARIEMEKAQTLVFNGGKWTCLGKNVAFMELNKVFVEILRRFDIAVVDPTRAWASINWGVFINKGMLVRITEREEKF